MDICKDITEVREHIDKIDNQIVQLVAERSFYVKQAANFKKDTEAVKAPQRVEAIISKVRKLAEDHSLNPDIIEIIYRNMINAFINMELDEHGKKNR